MKRKTFIYLSVASTVAMGLPSVYCRNRNGQLNKALSPPMFLSHICDANTIREIGNAYRDYVPAESKEDKLVDLLLIDGTGKSISQSSDLSTINSLENKNINQDFDTGKTIVVKGWVLSITEARQCALFSLT